MTWQPIETAPDGRPICARRADGTDVMALQLSPVGAQFPHGEWVIKGDCSDSPLVEWREITDAEKALL